MRSLLAGVRLLQRAPRAALPLVVEGLLGGALVGFGVFAADASTITATAIFPLDLYFDIKTALASASDWLWFVAALAIAVLVRAGFLSMTLWLADGAPGRFSHAWLSACRLVVIAAVALLPAAVLFFTGVAIRYAPFVWLGALIGLIPALLFVRRAASLDVGAGKPEGGGVPEVPTFLSYALLLVLAGSAVSVLGRVDPWLAGLLFAFLGPVQALFLLGWREHLRSASYPGGGIAVTTALVIALVALVIAVVYDREIRDAAPTAKARAKGTLLLLGGVDSTSHTGALTRIDPRDLGWPRKRTVLLSYRGVGEPYEARDTRGDLDAVADLVADQLAVARPPRSLVGHSQAALVVDRLVADGNTFLARAAVLAAPPPVPPPLALPAAGEQGAGKPGADLARAFARLLKAARLSSFDLDAPASPTQLDAVVVDAPLARLAVWPLADSVWLDDDWRRPGEVNVVAFTDHVGVTNNARALATTRDFLRGRQVDSDETSWRGALVAVVRYLFEPWKP